jgi:hypothetical protein
MKGLLLAALLSGAYARAAPLAHGENPFDELLFTALPLLIFVGLFVYYRFFARRSPEEVDEEPAEPEGEEHAAENGPTGPSERSAAERARTDRAEER